MDIQKRIDGLGEYFNRMNMEQQLKNISVVFPKNWTVDINIAKKYNVNVNQSNEQENLYHFWVDSSEVKGGGFEQILDTIEHTIESNKIALDKIKILTEKMNILKTLFIETNDIEKLKNVTFSFNKKPPHRKPLIKNIIKEDDKIKKSEEEKNEITNKEIK